MPDLTLTLDPIPACAVPAGPASRLIAAALGVAQTVGKDAPPAMLHIAIGVDPADNLLSIAATNGFALVAGSTSPIDCPVLDGSGQTVMVRDADGRLGGLVSWARKLVADAARNEQQPPWLSLRARAGSAGELPGLEAVRLGMTIASEQSQEQVELTVADGLKMPGLDLGVRYLDPSTRVAPSRSSRVMQMGSLALGALHRVHIAWGLSTWEMHGHPGYLAFHSTSDDGSWIGVLIPSKGLDAANDEPSDDEAGQP